MKSKHFSVGEWESKHPAAEPYPVEWIESRWRPLAEMLDVIRDEANCAIKVTPNGGYRGRIHNRSVGGAAASRHMEGDAADIIAAGMTANELHGLILSLYSAGKILRLGGLGQYPGFVHVDVRPGDGKLARWKHGLRNSSHGAG